MHLDLWGATDIGCVRKRNEDEFLVDPALGLAIVADGIGGQHRGDIASRLAVRVVREHLLRFQHDLFAYRADPMLFRRQRVEERLREAVQIANSEVFRAGEALSKGKGMGCTLDAAIVVGETAFLAHVGDARTWLVRPGPDGQGVAHQLTEDHSVVQEKVRRGLLTPEQAAKAPGKNVITRAIGALPSVRVDTLVFEVGAGHRLVLCTDGVTRYLGADEIGPLCGVAPGPDGTAPARAVDEVIELARTRGGVDNITAVLVAIEAEPPPQVAVTATQLDDLRRIHLFEAATYRELRLLASVVETREVKAGKLLFREGQIGAELFCLVEGEVAITRNGQHLATLVPGQSFGEMSLLDVPVRSASALATQNVRVVVLGKHRFDQLLRQDDGVAQRLLWGMVQRLSAIVRVGNERVGR